MHQLTLKDLGFTVVQPLSTTYSINTKGDAAIGTMVIADKNCIIGEIEIEFMKYDNRQPSVYNADIEYPWLTYSDTFRFTDISPNVFSYLMKVKSKAWCVKPADRRYLAIDIEEYFRVYSLDATKIGLFEINTTIMKNLVDFNYHLCLDGLNQILMPHPAT